MASFKTLNVKSAVKSKSKVDLSCSHLTTAEIGQIIPYWCQEVVPDTDFKHVKGNIFARLAPLVKPSYGKMYFKTLEAFVPYFQVADGIDAWMTGRSTWLGKTPSSRFINRITLLNYFIYASTEVSAANVAAGYWYDFTCYNSSGTQKYYALTKVGKFARKILNSLGYEIPVNASLQTSSAWYKGIGAENISALPLLAFGKVYNDWMSQSQRYNISTLSGMLLDIKRDVNCTINGVSYYTASNHMLTQSAIANIISSAVLCYENDYFTSAWQYPNKPVADESYVSELSVPADGFEGGTVVHESDDNWLRGFVDLPDPEGEAKSPSAEGSGEFFLAQRALDFLQSYDNWVRRNNYSGSRDVQEVYSRFGIKPEMYRSNYAHLIDKQSSPIQIGDVTATAQDYVGAGNAANIELGDYAGKGIVQHSLNFSYQASDYGLILVLGWFTVAPFYLHHNS